MSTFGWSSSQAYAHEGFSGMNGRSDSAEYFYQSDFQTVLSFAESSGMSRFTFWSVNRDRECSPPDNGYTSSECSSVTQRRAIPARRASPGATLVARRSLCTARRHPRLQSLPLIFRRAGTRGLWSKMAAVTTIFDHRPCWLLSASPSKW